MDRDFRVRDYPYVVVRFACRDCPRIGRYQLAVLSERFGADALMVDVLEAISSTCLRNNEKHPVAAVAKPTCPTWQTRGRLISRQRQESDFGSLTGARRDRLTIFFGAVSCISQSGVAPSRWRGSKTARSTCRLSLTTCTSVGRGAGKEGAGKELLLCGPARARESPSYMLPAQRARP